MIANGGAGLAGVESWSGVRTHILVWDWRKSDEFQACVCVDGRWRVSAENAFTVRLESAFKDL